MSRQWPRKDRSSTFWFRYGTNIVRGIRTHEHKDSARIFGPVLSFSIVSTLFFGGVFKFNPTLFNVHLGLSIYIMVGRGHSRCQESDKDSARKGVSTS